MKIQNKLFLILFSFSLLLVTSLVLLMQWSIDKGMVDYVNSKEASILAPLAIELSEFYQQDNSWRSLENRDRKFYRLLRNHLEGSDFIDKKPPLRREGVGPMQNQEGFKRRPPPRAFNDRLRPPPKLDEQYAVVDHEKTVVVGVYDPNLEYSYTDIVVGNEVVGYFTILKRHRLTQGYELDFIEQQQHYFVLIALVVMLAVALVTVPVAINIVRPIKRIAAGMAKLSKGDYKQSLTVNRQDEIGALSKDFNQLAVTLLENEEARKRWLANTSHELRTPLSILRGELEAMLDGVRPLSQTNILSLSDEVAHLEHLIDDLHQLSSADIGGLNYTMKVVNLNEWLSSEANKYKAYLKDANIAFELAVYDHNLTALADKVRLNQLLSNVMSNAVKYAQASNVKLSLCRSTKRADSALIIIEDNGIGVEEKHLPHLFEYLYRVDDSRNRKTGGSGLGLSICAHIINAHQGTISARASELGGLAILIELPINSTE